MSDAGGTFVQRVVFEGDAGPLVEAIRQVSAATSESIARAREQVTSGELAPGDYTAQLRAAQTQLETIIAESRAAIRELGGVAAPQSLSAVTAAATAARREQSRAGVAAGVEGFVPTAEAASAANAAVGATAANERIVVAANMQATAAEEAAATTAAGAAEEAKTIQKKIQLRLGQIQVLRDELQLEETTLSAESGLAAITTEYDLLRGRAGARASYNYQAGKAAGAVPPDQATLNAQAIAESQLAVMQAQAEATTENLALVTEEKILRQQLAAALTVTVETQILQNHADIIYGRAQAERASQLSIAAKRMFLPEVRSGQDIEDIGQGQAAQKLSNTQEAAVRERTLAEEELYYRNLAERNINARRSAISARGRVTLETTQEDVETEALVIGNEKLLAERQRIGIAEASLGREIEDLSAISDITVLRARRVVLEKAMATQSEAQLAAQAEQLGLANPNQSSGGRGLFGGVFASQGSGLARGLVGGFGAIAVFAGLRESVTYAVELEKALTAVQSRMDALGQGGQFEALRGHILEMSRDSGQSAVVVANASVRMTAAFGDVTQGVQATESAIKLAVVAGAGLSETADQLIAIGKAYNLTGQQVGQISDTIYSAATRFGITVGELTRGMATLAESGQFAGLSLSEQANILSKVAQVSQTDANQAAERLTRILPLIDAKANQLVALSREDSALGAVLKPEDFAGADSASRVFRILGENFNNFSQQTQSALLSIVGSGRGAQSLLPIFANFNEVMTASADSAKKAGGVNEAYKQQQETLAQTVKRLREEFNQLTLALTNSSGVFGAFNSVLKVLEDLVKWFNELNSVTDSIPGKLAAIAIGLKAIDVIMMKIAGESVVAGVGGGAVGVAAEGAATGGFLSRLFPGAAVGAGGGLSARLARPGGGHFATPEAFGEGGPGVGELAIGLLVGSEIAKRIPEPGADTSGDDTLLKLEQDFKNTERNKRRAANNVAQAVTGRYRAADDREKELKKKILALDPTVDFKDVDAAIKKEQGILQQSRAVGDQATADEAAATAAENAPLSEQPIAAVKAAYDAGVITTQAYLNRLTEERRITLDLAKSGVQRNTNLVAAANMTKEINSLIDQQALAADQLITAMENATGDPNASANNISRLVGRLSGPNQLLDPADRQKIAAQIYDAERKQLDDLVGRAQSATAAARIGAQGVRIPDTARAATLVAQITASNPKFVQALVDAAGGDKDLGQAILDGYAARVVAGEKQDQALRDSIGVINAQRKAAFDAQIKLYNDTVAANRGLPAGEREPLPRFPTYTPVGIPGATDATGAPGATAKETPDQQAAREKAERTEQRQLATEKVNADAALAQARARGNAVAVAHAEVNKAKQEQLDAEQLLADAGKDSTLQAQAEIAKTKALADKIKADNSLADANGALIDARLGLTEALASAAGNDTEAARIALQRGQDALQRLIEADRANKQDPNNDPAVIAQKGAVAGLQKTYLDTQRSTSEEREKFLLDTHQITIGAYIAFLQGELQSVGLSIKDQQRIQLEIYNLQTQGSGPFNIPSSIKLPTLYEVRRFQAAEQGQTSVDNRTINVQMYVNNGMDQAAATQWLTDITQGGSSVLGTVTRRYP